MLAIQHCTQLKAYYQPVRRCGKVKEGKNKIGGPMRLVLKTFATSWCNVFLLAFEKIESMTKSMCIRLHR